MNREEVNGVKYLIGASIGIGIGTVLCVNTVSIVLFDMLWISRLEAWFIRCVWAIPLTICTSYLIGSGVGDREILGFHSNAFAILFLPHAFNDRCEFSDGPFSGTGK